MNTLKEIGKEKLQNKRGTEKEQLQHQIEKIDKEIDEKVYALYGITEKEKKIIENIII